MRALLRFIRAGIGSLFPLLVTVALLGAWSHGPTDSLGPPSAADNQPQCTGSTGAPQPGQSGLEANDIWSLDVELTTPESELEDEDDDDGHTKGVVAHAASTRQPELWSEKDERFRLAIDPFVPRVGAYRELPRGPPPFS